MSAELLTAWRSSLAELGELGAVLRDAIQRDDALCAIATMHELRRTRSALGRIDAPVALAGTVEEAAAIAELTALTGNARMAELTMQQWLGRPLPGDAALLASPLGTVALADAMLPEVWDTEMDLVVLVGDGLDGVAQVLDDLGQRRVITLDASTEVGTAIHTRSLEELSAAVRTLVPNIPPRYTIKAAVGASRERVELAASTVGLALGDLRVNSNTIRMFSTQWFEQGLANLPAVARWPSVATVGDAFAGQPMVIVAPGPSLARNAHLLKGLVGKAIITCFSHSLKPVLAAGVTPDFVITVDPQDVRYHFEGCDVSRSCLVNAVTVHPALFELPAARFLSLSANTGLDDWIFDALGEEARVPGGGSVATTAFSLALRWKCDPIIFVGLDLSFSDGAYYVASSIDGGVRARVENGTMRVDGWSAGMTAMKAESKRIVAPEERAIELPGWHGGTVPSSYMFGLFHRWFVSRVKYAGDTTVLNCTEGGAAIEGMRHMRLDEVELEGSVDVAGALADHVGSARHQRVSAHLDGYSVGFRRVRSLVGRARALIDAGDSGPALERVERILTAALRPLQFVSLLAQRELERAHDTAQRSGTVADFLAASRKLLDALIRALDQLEPAVARARARLG